MRHAIVLMLAATSAMVATLPAMAQPPAGAHLPPLDRVLPPRAETIYQAVAPRIDTSTAMDIVTAIAPLWRLAGNPEFDRSLELIAARLDAAGIATRYDTIPSTSQGWEMRDAVLRLDGPEGEVVLSREQDRVPLAINSFATPPGGTSARLVDVGRGTEARHYEATDVAGAVVLADGPIGTVWTEAVKVRGAAGVISTQIAAYTQPDTTPDVLQWGSIPYAAERPSFGFKATPRAARRLRARLAAGAVTVHVTADTVFHRRLVRTLVAEFPGTRWPDDRVVLVAHVQEPGANDNASGSGTLLAAALALQAALVDGALPRPARTLTLLWGDENRASDAWIAEDADRVSRVLAMMSLDMTGEDTTKTGGTFLIEKGPDPTAVWERPTDPHTQWGASEVEGALVKGSFLNDLHLAVALRRARDTGWVVRTNPYEGGSDHTSFTKAGVPALLNWHFTDRYYHTNLDTIDKVSPAAMGHVATVVATTAMFLASAIESDVVPLQALLTTARDARLAAERQLAASADILDAWTTWYAEALTSAGRVGQSAR
ncbi:MAG: M28 family peptidase [Acidobacteria bacterium]|nr:M28 family peptidase [Acidobacteriota bacterium]